jgi:hypothetical protein
MKLSKRDAGGVIALQARLVNGLLRARLNLVGLDGGAPLQAWHIVMYVTENQFGWYHDIFVPSVVKGTWAHFLFMKIKNKKEKMKCLMLRK